MRLIACATLLLLVLPAPALPDNPSPRMKAILDAAATHDALRARLLACADSAAAARDVGTEGEACALAASSYGRDGLTDSAIVLRRRSLALLANDEELSALVDQLLYRRGPGDPEEAIRLLEDATQHSDLHNMVGVTGRLAWARFLAGQTDSAARLFASMRRHLKRFPEWRYRMARVDFARKDYRSGVEMLLPEAVRSRGTDQDVLGMLEEAGKSLGMTPRFQEEVARLVYEHDRGELALAQSLGGRLVTLGASDGFPLGGLVTPAAAAGTARAAARPRPVIVLLAPEDTLGSADSLVLALRRHGVPSLVIYPRGSGSSVGPSCPGPDAWYDRESALQARVAEDIRDAFRALPRLARVDTTGYVVAAEGRAITMAVGAAALDRRVKALLLVSPSPAAVDRGPVRQQVARLQLPIFFQITPEEYGETFDVADALYQAGNRRASRVVEASRTGRGLAQFRGDPELAVRFLKWLDATRAPAATPRPRVTRRATPPAPRR